MSVGDKERDAEANKNGAGDLTVGLAPAKQARFDRCFTGLDFKLGKGPLKDMDSDKIKREIQRWAKAVVAYARQLSFKSPKTLPSRLSSEKENAESASGDAENTEMTNREAKSQ